MRGAYAIARHEFLRRWPLFVVGLALGLTAMFLAGPDTQQLTQFEDALVTIAVVVCWIIAFTTGLQILGRPLHDGRLSFYFTRPIPAAGIAIGKAVGGLAALALMHVALMFPLSNAFTERVGQLDRNLATTTTLVGLGFFVVGLVVGILARSRSRWFVVDIAGAGAAALVAVGMFGGFGARKVAIAKLDMPVLAQSMLDRADMILYGIVAVAAIAMLIAVIVGITRGRTDRDLVHRAISVTLWPALTAIGLAGIGIAHWGLL